MKKKSKIFVYMITAAILLTGCARSVKDDLPDREAAAEESSLPNESIQHTDENETPAGGSPEQDDALQNTDGNEASAEGAPKQDNTVLNKEENETPAEGSPKQDDALQNTGSGDASADEVTADAPRPEFDIIWLGDSLTQGSLGPDNKNEDNPQAPWRVLASLTGLNVDGWGLYGYNTHDILWVFGKNDGLKDPRVIYIFWVGSNDFYDSPDNIGHVIEEIDNFNTNAGITRYLVLGTTNRGDLEEGFQIPVNNTFAARYGDQYLDIMPYVEFGPDRIHLTEDSYHKVAEAVYEKLRSLGYIR